MGAWDSLVDDVKSAIEDEFDPEYRDHDRTVYENVDSCMPTSDWELLELAQDNRAIFRYRSQSGHSTIEQILNEAIYDLLTQEAWGYVAELERDIETCDHCGVRFLPSKSEADDNQSYCSDECQFEEEAINCEECHNEYLESESDATESDRFCDAECEHQYKVAHDEGDENDDIG